ncbi:MAG: Ger(x)C family spore germination protein [Bacillota bacterium]|nr:Ger(x)C family spore germination protein [Bacillota bacterium]
MIKKALLFSLFIISSFILGGCWDQQEVNDLAFVTAAGIDKSEDGKVELTVLIFIPKGKSSQQGMEGGGGGGAADTLFRSAEGKTIADAMSTLQEKLPRHIFWGHCKVFIFDDDLAKEGLSTHVDFILRHPQLRERSRLFVSEEKAKDILSLIPPLERDISEVLKELSSFRIGMDVTAKDYAQMLIGDSNASALPLIKILPSTPGQEKQTIAYVTGTAIFKNGKMIGDIDDSVTRGVLWLRNEIRLATISVKPNGKNDGFVSMNLLRAKSKIIPLIENGKWKIKLYAVGNSNIVQNTTDLDLSSPEIIKPVEKQLKFEIKKRVNIALWEVQERMNADIFGFAEAFHQKYPKIWAKQKKRWDEIFPSVEVSFDTNIKIQNQGMNSVLSNHPLKGVENK